MQRDEAQRVVEDLISSYQTAVAAVEAANAEFDAICNSIRSEQDHISGLKEYRRELRGYARESVNSELGSSYERLRDYRDARRIAVEAQRSCRSRLGGLHGEMRRTVQRLARLQRSDGRTRLSISVGGISAAGSALIGAAYGEAEDFAEVLVRRLESALSGGMALETEQLQSDRGAEAAASSVPGGHSMAAPAVINITHDRLQHEQSVALGIEARRVVVFRDGESEFFVPDSMHDLTVFLESTYDYEILLGPTDTLLRGSVPYRVFTLPRSRWDQRGRTAERFAVETAMAWMTSRGRRAVVALGGPGKPDILSLTQDGRLVRSEIKGTFNNTPLAGQGVFRTVRVAKFERVPDVLKPSAVRLPDGSFRVTVAENSREWVQINAGSILRSLDLIAKQVKDPSMQASYIELADKFKRSYRDGRIGREASELVQVGQGGPGGELPYPDASTTMSRYCYEARPDQIVQLQVGD